MIDTLKNLNTIGHVLNESKLEYTSNNVPKTKVYLKVKGKKRIKREDGSYAIEKHYTTLPFHVFGHTAQFFEKYIVKGQKIAVEYSLDSYRDSNKEGKYPHPYLVITSVEPLERSEAAVERMEKWKREKEEEQENIEKINDAPVNSVVETDDAVEMYSNVTLYDISDEDLSF